MFNIRILDRIDEKTRNEFVAGFVAGAVCLGGAAVLLLMLILL